MATFDAPGRSQDAEAGRQTVSDQPFGHHRVAKPIHCERSMKIICIGAGASGLLFAYKLQRSFEKFDLTIYEKNRDIAGTWYENRYPGCACDVPSHNYTWSFEPSTEWPAVYSGSKDIYKYFDGFSRKYGLHNYCHLEHEVVGASWNHQRNEYDVKIKDVPSGAVFDDYCDILINAGGILNAWRWPAIPGLQNFKGKLLHTANYDEDYDLTNKYVVTTFIREPTWVSPVNGLEQHVFTGEERANFVNNPDSLLEYRRSYERGLNTQFSIFLRNTQNQQQTRQYMHQAMKDKLQNADLEAKLIPQWAVECRRLTPGVGYLESLGKDNVKVVYGEIERVTANGCVCDDGKKYAVDVLICATGLDTSFKPRFPLVNHQRKNLQDEWAKEAKSYLGIAAPDFPNYFQFLGPNCPIGNGPLLSAMESQADYMLKMCNCWQTENRTTFSPRMDAVDDFIAHKDQFMKRTVWEESCRSWYKNNSASGKVSALWPGSTMHYMEAMKDVRFEDWNIKYEGNRFAWLGNGYSQPMTDHI
ncbi:hypothetical protein MBLNU459_g3836t1 [Dothideomycetes sp. NU459]